MDPDFHVSSARFSHSFHNFSQINKLTFSPACWIQNLPWKIFIEPTIKDGRKYLSVYVGCTQSGGEHWSCNAVVEEYKLHGSAPKIIRANKSLIFDSAASTSWGHEQFIQWDVVSNPVNGFLRDGSVTIEVTLTAELPVGLILSPDHFTDERANRSYIEWTSEKFILEEKLQSLSNLNEDNVNKINSYLKTIEDLENRVNKNKDAVIQSNEYERNLQSELVSLKQLQDKNKACENDLKTERENNEKFKVEINNKNTDIKNLQEKFLSVSKQLEDSRNISKSNDSLCKEKLKITETENDSLKNKLTLAEGNLKNSEVKLQSKIDEHASQIKSIQLERDNLKASLDKISKDYTLAKEELSLLKSSNSEEQDAIKKKEEELIKTLQDLRNQVENLNEANQALNNSKVNLEQQVSTLQVQLKENSGLKETVQGKQNIIDNLNTENQNLIAQMKIGYDQYNKLKNEKEKIESQLKITKENSSKVDEEGSRLRETVTTTQKDLSECKQKLEQVKTENENLSANIRSSNSQLEEIKNRLSSSENDSSEMTDLKNYCEKLKSEITTLINSLTDSRNEIQRMKNKFKKRTTNEESLQIDLNNKNAIKQENGTRDTKSSDNVELGETESKYKIAIDAKNKLKCEMEVLKKKFEKTNKDAYETYLNRNRNLTKELSDLRFKLEEERIEKLRILDRNRDIGDELKQLKQENEVQIKTKNTLLLQLRECHQLSKEVFWIIIELVKIKKSHEEMPCSIENRLKDIMEMLSINKKRVILTSNTREGVLNQPTSIQISTEVLQKKLEDLEGRLEKEIEIISSELKSEKSKIMQLILFNEKLAVILENEVFMRDQYKKLVRVHELRSQEMENRMSGSFSQLSVERNRRFQCEDDFQHLSKKIENMEVQTELLKRTICRQTLEFTDCSCTSSQNFYLNSVQHSTQIPSVSMDVKSVIAGCDSQTPTDEHPVHTPTTQYATNSNEATVNQAPEKNDEVVGNVDVAGVPKSNPISLSNAN